MTVFRRQVFLVAGSGFVDNMGSPPLLLHRRAVSHRLRSHPDRADHDESHFVTIEPLAEHDWLWRGNRPIHKPTVSEVSVKIQ